MTNSEHSGHVVQRDWRQPRRGQRRGNELSDGLDHDSVRHQLQRPHQPERDAGHMRGQDMRHGVQLCHHHSRIVVGASQQ